MAGRYLLEITAVHLVLTALPGVAAALIAARCGIRNVPVLLATGLAASGMLALLTFWAFFADPLVGETTSFLLLFGSVGIVAWLLWERQIEGALLRQLVTPLLLWGLGTYFLVFFGFLHGGTDLPLNTAATRFSGGFPSDNAIPSFFAEWFFSHGHQKPVPVFGADWLSSDRPPLQVGYVLEQRRLPGWDIQGLHYQVLAIGLQQLWIIGLWALLLAAKVGRTTRALAMATVLVSDVALVNGFFVWPKMLPAAMLLAAAALVATPLWDELRRSYWAAALLAALLGVAMMGHGSSLFGVVPLALIAAWRGLPSWRWLGVAALVGIAVMAPWSAYQKYHDPPGDRLVKWMIAGVPEVDPRGAREAIFDAYGEAGIGGTIHNKGQNFVTMFGGGPMVGRLDHGVESLDKGELDEAIEDVRIVLFFDLVPSLGLLLLGPVAMALAWRRGRRSPADWTLALTCFLIFGVGAIAWGLILFGNLPARTVMHAGSYAIPVLGLVGAVAGLRAVWPRFAIYFVLASAALMLAIYTPTLRPLEGTSFSPLAAIVSVLGLAGFGWVLLRGAAADDAPA
ncbi:MAG TPA: hypothetical protein VFX45_09010 [Solirubrobacterales bacterium]|nr:hypothetical protein [Solirubrobacterales bacterium]